MSAPLVSKCFLFHCFQPPRAPSWVPSQAQNKSAAPPCLKSHLWSSGYWPQTQGTSEPEWDPLWHHENINVEEAHVLYRDKKAHSLQGLWDAGELHHSSKSDAAEMAFRNNS